MSNDENEEALLRSEMSKRAAAFAELGADWRDHMVRRYNFDHGVISAG